MKIELTEQEWVLVINAMALGPYREVQPTIQKISQQVLALKEAPTSSD